MIRLIAAMLALLLAAPAPALAQSPPTPGLRAFTDDFDRFAMGTAGMPDAERVRLFRERFNALVPGFYEPRFGATEEKYNAHVARALAAYPAQRDKFLAAARDFRAAYDGGNVRFRRFFPDYAPTMPIYLVHSLGEMDGGTRDLRGKMVALFGADVIARIHDGATIGPFLDHELFHFYHARFFPDCEALWCSLWQEGLAVYVASKMNPGADDRALMLTLPRPIRPEVEPRFGEAVCFTRSKMDSTARADLTEFFFGDGSGKVFPPRFGYYVGYRLAQALGAKRDLKTLARMKPAQVRPLLQETMAKLASCR